MADRVVAQPAPPVVLAPVEPVPVGDPALGPEILLPSADEPDAELVRVGDLVLRKSHAYSRLQTAHPKLALSAVDLLVFDVLVARHAQQHGIQVDPARVEALAAAEERAIAAQVATELGDTMDLATYVWRLFGMRLADWRATLRRRTAQRLYQGYVIRYLALREDRVQVRFLVHKDRAVADEVVDKVRGGADFATLALRWSEDPSRRDGGLLPPFGRGFQHPIVEAAFGLQPGQASAPFAARHGEEQRWFVVYCLARLPGREVAFAAVRDEIDRDLEERPLSELEINAYTLRWRGELDAVPK
ncbi:MAG: peptidylprolyl isomerase [Planctomycetes bacterium]|nr:peptidylprolyl isomerase [Planctomycetota bacterium]